LHAPLPSHVAAGVNIAPEQLAAPQVVCASLGLQLPTVPVRLHDWQIPVQLWSQQTPPEQNPDTHSPAAAHAAPAALAARQAPD
jgi:hypothetical protein